MIHDGRKCPNCDYINEQSSGECARCGVSITGVTTCAVAEESLIDILQPLIQPSPLNVDEVMFLVAGCKDPITVKIPPDQTEIVLGRRAEGEIPPQLDLTDYGIAIGAVSRRHAALQFSGNQVSLEDLGSTNGTWINESRLTVGVPHPIRTGDLIRLGQQFVFVYFSASIATVDNVALTDTAITIAFNRRVTPEWLTHHLGNYLLALEGVQKTLCQILTQPAADVIVSDINLRDAPSSVQLQIMGASGAIRLLRVHIFPWRNQHLQQINQLWQTTLGNQDQIEAVRTTLFEDLDLLASKILEQLAPDMDRAGYLDPLVSNLRILALHSFELSIYDNDQ
jgi:hypothetical protein